MQSENINIFWSYLIIEELIRSGVDYFCISPGSRSTPLTSAAARHPKAQKKIFYDERAAAYHAVGYARGAGKPAVLICTSGTAAVNYFPAVVEACNDRLPLIILSADRPPELLQTQANQTIKQHNLYGDYVKWHFTMPVPTEDIPPQTVLSTVDLMVSKAAGTDKGPVHLNCMFREPLEPKAVKVSENYMAAAAGWLKSHRPYTEYSPGVVMAEESVINRVSDAVKSAERGLLVLGRLPVGCVLEELIEKLGWPVFADITSGCRHLQNPYMIQNFDHLLFDDKFNPDTVLHIGAQFASKRLLKLMPKIKPDNYILIEESGERIDAEHIVTLRVRSDAEYFTRELSNILPERNTDSGWFEEVKRKQNKVGKVISAQFAEETKLTEIEIAHLISREISPSNALFLSNSMPVRDMNSFALPNDALRFVGANRGASGIDGIIASATGFAQGLRRATVLLIGDLAFLHDLNSLHIVKNSEYPLIIVLLNNRGGGIFHFLPVSQHNEIFKDYFLTPHDYTFENAARQFSLSYRAVNTKDKFIDAFQKAQHENHTAVIEVKTDSKINFQMHVYLNDTLKSLLADES